MTPFDFAPAQSPTFYFIGVTTGQSSIMQVFPRWAQHLGLGACVLRGIDCELHDDPEVYRKIVGFLKHDEFSLGALITSHKLDLLRAARDMFDELGPHASQLGEISCISKRDGRLVGHAKDTVTSGIALDAIIPQDYWAETGAELCILGAGGSSLALTVNLQNRPAGTRPARICVTNRSEKRLTEMKRVLAGLDCPVPVECFFSPTPEHNDAVVAQLSDCSLVANATGLGKDAPGSPLTDATEFPRHGIAWDFNYRGDLVFLEQARAQEKTISLTVADGWIYFVHGWLSVMTDVFHMDVPSEGPAFDELSRIAAAAARRERR